MINRIYPVFILVLIGLFLSFPSLTFAVSIRSASGATAADIQAAVDTFRTDLGTLNPNVAGSFGSGRREINWDGVPNNFAAPNNLPFDFFNVNSPRGAVLSTAGTAVQVSANAGVAPVRFDNINITYSSIFQTFSPQRLFTALGSNIVDVNFFVPGSNTPASASGFGSVFTDVTLANTTSIQYFNSSGSSLGTFFVPTSSPGGLSFLGVSSFADGIARVRLTNGNSPLGPNNGGSIDVVVMDDFFYGEPVPTPEPSTLLLLGSSLVGLYWRKRSQNAQQVPS